MSTPIAFPIRQWSVQIFVGYRHKFYSVDNKLNKTQEKTCGLNNFFFIFNVYYAVSTGNYLPMIRYEK